jgi:hypothetical protein
MLSLLCWLALCGTSDEAFAAWTAEAVRDAATLPATQGKRLSQTELDALREARPALPYRDLTAGIRLKDGGLWLGSRSGLLYRAAGAESWRVFHSRQWLPDDHILDVSIAHDGSAYVRTPAGMGRIYPQATTLDRKLAEVHAELRHRHVREGLIGAINLKVPGRLDGGWIQPDDDNDGLWTSLYVAAESFRYGVTADARAKENAWQSLEALMMLEKVTGISGFAARSILPASQPEPRHGEWHRSADGRWWWKGDTSCDELVGHYFAYAVYFDLAATAQEKDQIRQVVGRITDHILDHGYNYVGPSGKPTTWGVWAPEKLNRELKWVGDRGLNSLEILSHLKVADHITGKTRYADAARELIERHGYAINTVWQKHIWPPIVNHSDDQLAFLSYYPLLRYERDPSLRKIYLASLERSWRIERPEQSPLFNFIYAAGRQADWWTDTAKRPSEARVDPRKYDHDICLEWFRDVPLDLIDWTVKNSDRQDLGELQKSRHRQTTSSRVLNVAERPLMRWNGDPYELDGGCDGRRRDDGTFILLPYWLGRYHRFVL